MKLFTFTAPSPALALQKAQQACGRDALVVSTKQIKKKSLTQDALYELVVAVEDDVVIKTQKSESKQRPKPIFDDDILENITQTANQLSKLEKLTNPLETTKTNSRFDEVKLEIKNDEFKQIKDEIGTLSDKIKILQNMLWNENEHAKDLTIPPEFAEIYRVAKKSGIKDAHLNEIMQETIKLMPSNMRNSTKTIKRYFHVLLKKMIPTRIEKEIPKGEKKIMMFVGPTGVGKTTTLAKLAAKYSFLEYKNRVGIITLDTYRIGALEQLFQYAKMLKLPIEDVTDSIDFQRSLDALRHCDLILIDTAGSSQHDREKILKIAEFIKHTQHHIDVNLVLSASSKLEDLNDIYKNFSFLNIDTLVITKLDETKSFGNIFSLIVDSKRPVSYFSVGQEVPDDIEVASGDFLVNCLFEGFSKKAYS
jgi:flagellar biosynthesis protein FlhF